VGIASILPNGKSETSVRLHCPERNQSFAFFNKIWPHPRSGGGLEGGAGGEAARRGSKRARTMPAAIFLEREAARRLERD
jgi:hypothetical protein